MLTPSKQYKRGLKQAIDWKLIVCYLLLVFIGLANIYASVHTSDSVQFFDLSLRSGKQMIWIGTSLLLATLILFVVKPRFWELLAGPSYLFILFLLVAVIFLSNDVKGSHSWFELGPIKFQPAEISKISTSLMLAAVMSKPNFHFSRIKDFLMVVGIIAVPMLAIIAESETGSALVYIGFVFALYREGLSGWFIALAGMCILLFVLTLTASPYVSVLVLWGITSICMHMGMGKKGHWALIVLPVLVFFALLPWLCRTVCELIIPGSIILDKVDASVAEGIVNGSPWKILLDFKPLQLLIIAIGVYFPICLVKAYKEKFNSAWALLLAFVVGVALIVSTQYIFTNILKDHQRSRIEVLLGMKEDPSGVGYNVNQSKIAIGSGGLIGKGYLKGTQTAYGFVPEQSTDFIFCTVGEEWGFIGCIVVIFLYVFIIFRIINDAEQSREAFTRIYGYCVASCIFMHLFINIGMTIGLMPVIGIPLPLLSYGGSSLWAFSILLFIFIALDREENKYF